MITNRNQFGAAQQKFDEEMFIDNIKEGQPYTIRELEYIVRCSKDTAKKYMDVLVERGFLKKKKMDIGWVYWKKLS